MNGSTAKWVAVLMTLSAAGCHEGADSKGAVATVTAQGRIRSIRIKIVGAYQKIGIVAKASNGQTYPAQINPVTGQAILNLPKTVKAVVYAQLQNAIKKMIFAKTKAIAGAVLPPGVATRVGAKLPSPAPGKADAADPADAFGAVVPGTPFSGPADLGEVDFSAPGELIVMGQVAGTRSIWQFVDTDGDQLPDFLDDDDDGDGTPDAADPDWVLPIDWFDATDASGWTPIPDADLCDWAAGVVCTPPGFVTEADCATGGDVAKEFCTFPGDPGYTEGWFACYSTCLAGCGEDGACGRECAMGCLGLGPDAGGTAGTDAASAPDASEGDVTEPPVDGATPDDAVEDPDAAPTDGAPGPVDDATPTDDTPVAVEDVPATPDAEPSGDALETPEVSPDPDGVGDPCVGCMESCGTDVACLGTYCTAVCETSPACFAFCDALNPGDPTGASECAMAICTFRR